jgi:hypothetical protein
MPHKRRINKRKLADTSPTPYPRRTQPPRACREATRAPGSDEENQFLTPEEIRELERVSRIIERQIGELEQLRHRERSQKTWISGLAGEFTACCLSSHLLT